MKLFSTLPIHCMSSNPEFAFEFDKTHGSSMLPPSQDHGCNRTARLVCKRGVVGIGGGNKLISSETLLLEGSCILV